MNRIKSALSLSAWLLLTMPSLEAASLKGVSFELLGKGQYWGYPGVEVHIRQNGNWLNDSNGFVNFPLLNGNNTFEYFVSGNGIQGTAGMSFVLGNTCTSGISASIASGLGFGALGTNTFWPTTPHVPTPPNVTCGGGFALGSGSLTWTDGTDTVVLTQLSYTDHLSSGVNLVNYASVNPPNQPDFWPDHYGTFTLQVNGEGGGSAIPEPSTIGMVAIAALALSWRKR